MKSQHSAYIIASIFLLSSAVLAHPDWKSNPATVAAAPLRHWTGFYAGLNVGGVGHTMDVTDNQAVTFNATIRQASNPALTGGFQVGWRRQMDGTATTGVYGVEFSANIANAEFTQEYGSSFALYQIRAKNELNNLCLLQLTGGLAADRTLLFLAAGLSWTNLTGSLTNQDSIASFNSVNLNNNVLGTAVGGGVEYAFTDKLSLRFKLDLITPKTYTAHDDAGNSYLVANSIFQGTLGLNWRFG